MNRNIVEDIKKINAQYEEIENIKEKLADNILKFENDFFGEMIRFKDPNTDEIHIGSIIGASYDLSDIFMSTNVGVKYIIPNQNIVGLASDVV